jgi:hypothetical protein
LANKPITPTVEQVKKDIIKIAKTAKIEPIAVTKTIYNKYGGNIPEWQLRKLGGLNAIIKSEFPENDLNLEVVRATANRKQYVEKLRRELGDWEYHEKRLAAMFNEALRLQPVQVIARKPYKEKKTRQFQRMTHALVSDTHFGLFIDPLEVEHNNYTWETAARRFGLFVDAIASFKKDHRSECGGLILNFAGDICQGQLHPEEHNADLLTWQIVGATRYIVQAIDYLLDFYPKITVPVTTDNHMRIVNHVKGKERARAQKFDSYNSIMFSGVQFAFRNEPRVQFIIPRTPYTRYRVFNRMHLITHGDTFVNVGYVAKNINVQNLTAQLDKINAQSKGSEQIEVFLSGHVHNGLYIELQNGVHAFVNPSLSGIDPFAQSLGMIKSNPGQWLFESIKEHAVGDMRLVSVKEADNDKAYDEIITPFDYSLALRKCGL